MLLLPRTIRLPDPSIKLVHLDIKDWIKLTQAFVGHSEGKGYQSVLEACLTVADAGSVIFPLSQHTYNEIRKVNYRKSKDVVLLIERLSSYQFILHRSVVAKHEIEALLDLPLGPCESPMVTADYLQPRGPLADRNLMDKALEQIKIFVRTPAGIEDIRNRLHAQMPKFFERHWRKFNRDILIGLAPEEEAALHQLGWNPKASLERYKWIAEDHERLARLLDDEPAVRDSQELRKLIAQIEWDKLSEIFCDSLHARLATRGIDVSKFSSLTCLEILSAIAQPDHMPSFDVAVSLQVSLHRNSEQDWSSNHVFDYETLAVTAPYCDIVVTDKEMAHHIRASKLNERLKARVLSRLLELPKLL